MRVSGIAIALTALSLLAAPIFAQNDPPAESLLITAQNASTWTEDQTHIILLEGPVTIDMDRAHMSANQAVIWLRPKPGAVPDQLQVQIALIGDARLEQPQQGIKRNSRRLMVQGVVRGTSGTIRITAEQRIARDASDSPLYREANGLKSRPPAEVRRPPLGKEPPSSPPDGKVAPPSESLQPSSPPAAVPATQPVQLTESVQFQAPGQIETFTTEDGKVAIILSGGALLVVERDNNDLIELKAERAVVFTTLPAGEIKLFGQEESVQATAAYLEGDVRILHTPAAARLADPRVADQRLEANRVYYEFASDRAVMTDAVLHTIEPLRQNPIVLRAQILRQLSLENGRSEYMAEDVELSTSSFATPSYSVAADKAYVRQVDTGDPRLGTRTNFSASNSTLNMLGVPIFYLPTVGGSVTSRGFPLRGVEIENSRRFGVGAMTEWGLFETLGIIPPADLDAAFQLGYYSDRGPAGGISADYGGGFITDTKDPWYFTGDFDSFFVHDNGFDDLGGDRTRVDPPRELRGRILWEHQHFFPDDWQVQLRGGYVSDPTFLEQWFENDFNNDLPHDVSAYFKRQRDTEALSLLLNFQPNDFVTTSDLLQEQFEVERLPELGYRRIGDSLADDRLTFFSENTLSRLRFKTSDASLAEQGFGPGLSPGLPSQGLFGTQSSETYRGDFRQEIDYPLTAGQFRLVPYILGRYTPYSDSPDGDSINRLFMGTGLRVTTAFWKTDDSFESALFDVHRLRHVIEPQLHLFTSAQTIDRNELFIYDEEVDAIHDVSAAQIALRQRWQTKRGGPGRWRSVDFLTLNVEGNFFANQPSDNELQPRAFRGLFFASLPEASVPRNSINADAIWRISDTTALLSDVEYNLDETELATASIGLAVQRSPRLSYFIGTRYIEELDSNITSFASSYELTRKYNVSFSHSFDFGEGRNVATSASIVRRFDRFFASLTIYHDDTNDENGVTFNLYPDLGYGAGGLQNVFQQ